ncbi:hypothetical protein B9G55_20090 [Saccharibacillus sp. O16]|nr:hypothetical protein B9G55_20090 [Saccharibacillus sp. O16]
MTLEPENNVQQGCPPSQGHPFSQKAIQKNEYAAPGSRQVTRYRQEDREDAVRMLGLCGAEERVSLLPGQEKGPLERKAFIVRSHSGIDGIALLWQKGFHPLGRYLNLYLRPDQQDLRVAEALMEVVQAEAGGRAIQVLFRENELLAVDFYTRFGFAEMRRTYMPHLDLAKVKLTAAEEQGAAIRDDCLHIRSFAELQGNEAALNGLAQRMRASYEKAHEGNPPQPYPLTVWRTFSEADDLWAEGSFAALNAQGDEVLAFASLHKGEAEHEAELGWMGAESGFETLLEIVDRKRMAYSLAHGFIRVSAEIDNTDRYQITLLDKYPFEPAEPLLTYRREAGGTERTETGEERLD